MVIPSVNRTRCRFKIVFRVVNLYAGSGLPGVRLFIGVSRYEVDSEILRLYGQEGYVYVLPDVPQLLFFGFGSLGIVVTFQKFFDVFIIFHSF